MKLLVTGGAGFIGCNFIRRLLSNYPSYTVINLDKLTYSGNLRNLADLKERRGYSFIRGDICNRKKLEEIVTQGLDAVINFAAESHVDRSIQDASHFVHANVLGVQCLLDVARRSKIRRFIQVSTDEVYGSVEGKPAAKEDFPLCPNSPYAASKAAADLLCRAYSQTYETPVIITRSTNNYGPFQHPEKLIPLMIANALENKPLPVYGDGMNKRDWIHVLDHCAALDAVLHRGRAGEIYNIGVGHPRPNLEIVQTILGHLHKDSSLITFVKDRPGHDREYHVNTDKIRQELGWSPQIPMDEGLRETVNWYQSNPAWLRASRSSRYWSNYRRWYGNLEPMADTAK